MEEMRAFFDQLAAQANKQEVSGAGKTRDAVEDFIRRQLSVAPRLRSAAAPAKKSLRSVAARNDVRSQPYLGVNVTPLPVGTNVFADSRHHVHAAARLATLAQESAGFDADMPTPEVDERLRRYISEFAGAPHWLLVAQRETSVHHNTTDPCQLTRDLIATLTATLNENKVDQGGIHSATNSVNLLASTLSSSAGVASTLYATMGLLRRTPEEGPVFYHVSFTSPLQMDHQQYRKSQALSTPQVQTFTFLFQLDSQLLLRFADIYNQLYDGTVDDWFHGLNNI